MGSQRATHRFVEFQSGRFLERRMSDGRLELSDVRSQYADQRREVPAERQVRLCLEARLHAARQLQSLRHSTTVRGDTPTAPDQSQFFLKKLFWSFLERNSIVFERFQVIAARHLNWKNNLKRAYVSPYVEIEIIGHQLDTANSKQTTKTIADNGFNPLWDDETFEFYVSCPSLALLRFAVYDLDMFGDNHLIAQATYPVGSIRQGFRSVPLKNTFSEHLELAGLLVHMNSLHQEDVKSASGSFHSRQLRDLSLKIQEAETRGDNDVTQEARQEFHRIQSAIETRLTEAAERRMKNFHSSVNATNQSRLSEIAD